jgi:hypothetical protein
VRHLRWREEILLDLDLAIDRCARGRTPLVIDGALLTSFLKPLLVLSLAIVVISFQLLALLNPAHFVLLVNALRQLSNRAMQTIQGLKSE